MYYCTVVKQAAPMLVHTLPQLLQDMRVRAQLKAWVSERIDITNITFYTLSTLLHEARIRPILHLGVSAPAADRVNRAEL